MIEITIVDAVAGRALKDIKAAALVIAKELDITNKHVDIFLVGDKQMKKNVLAFPSQKDFPRPDLDEPALGEIHLNPSYIKGHDEDLLLMLVHGFLHLLGYDHEEGRDRIRMERKEQELLQSLNALHHRT